jgi:hypothetical protein
VEAPKPSDLFGRPRASIDEPEPEPEPASDSDEFPPQLRQFAWFPLRSGVTIDDPADRGRKAWADVLESLRDLAEDEEWTGATPTIRPLPILDSFLRYTYQRLVMEQKIAVSDGGEYAAFNTGLLTAHAEDVFGLFRRNQHEDAQPWVFLRWATESDREILRYFGEPPLMAEYVTTSANLVYDWRRPLKLAYEHILIDNIDRFPVDLQRQPLRAKQALDHAVFMTLKRVRRNHKVVVPQWYPKLGDSGAQFLMPLDLTGSGHADLALVVSEVGVIAYRGHTVLTLEMAYTNARLVARPDSDWLKPQAPTMPATEEAFDDHED